MLTITDRQYAEIHRVHVAAFRAKIAAWLRGAAPAASALNDAELQALIERQEPRAARFGLVTERDIAKWCFLAVMTGEQFDKHTAVIAFLSDSRQGARPSDRLDGLMREYAQAAMPLRPASHVRCCSPRTRSCR
jgi:hypothetical protein